MFPKAFLLRLGVFLFFFSFPEDFISNGKFNGKISQTKRQKILIEQSRLLDCGLVGRVGQVKKAQSKGGICSQDSSDDCTVLI